MIKIKLKVGSEFSTSSTIDLEYHLIDGGLHVPFKIIDRISKPSSVTNIGVYVYDVKGVEETELISSTDMALLSLTTSITDQLLNFLKIVRYNSDYVEISQGSKLSYTDDHSLYFLYQPLQKITITGKDTGSTFTISNINTEYVQEIDAKKTIVSVIPHYFKTLDTKFVVNFYDILGGVYEVDMNEVSS